MSTKAVQVRATVESRSDAAPFLRASGDAVVVARGRARLFVLRCPCGCGQDIVLNLDPAAGPRWRMTGAAGGVSLFPSVWRDSGCESHFIVSRGRAFMFGSDEDSWWRDSSPSVQNAVSNALSAEYQSAADLAELLAEEPWEVLRACRKLVRDGNAEERSRPLDGFFRRASARSLRDSSSK